MDLNHNMYIYKIVIDGRAGATWQKRIRNIQIIVTVI